MVSLHTSYLGLTLDNPVLAGSCGLTGTLTSLKMLEEKGVGAVVLKSLFEEQILMQTRRESAKGGVIYGYEEIDDYIGFFERRHQINDYMELVRRAKESLSVPVIASVNCVSDGEWSAIASAIEEAGADALQLNIFVPPFGFDGEARAIESEYLEILKRVKSEVSIPVSAKIGYFFTDIAAVVEGLSSAGADGIVLFNRYYPVDFDIEKMEVSSGSYFSAPEELSLPLRWTSLLYGEIDAPLTGATGIHDGDGLIKLLLAGAQNVEVASALYRHGPDRIGEMKSRLGAWMEQKGFSSIEQFRGKMSRKSSEIPSEYLRVQYMKRYGDLKG